MATRCCGCAAKGLAARDWTNFTGPWSRKGRPFTARQPDQVETLPANAAAPGRETGQSSFVAAGGGVGTGTAMSLGGVPMVAHVPLIFPGDVVPHFQAKLVEWNSARLRGFGWVVRVWGLENGTRLVEERYPALLPAWRGYAAEHGSLANILRADALGYVVLHAFGGLLLDADTLFCDDPARVFGLGKPRQSPVAGHSGGGLIVGSSGDRDLGGGGHSGGGGGDDHRGSRHSGNHASGGGVASFPWADPAHGEVINAALASPPGHMSMAYALRALAEVYRARGPNSNGVLLLTGPRLLANALQQLNQDLRLGFPNFCEGEDYLRPQGAAAESTGLPLALRPAGEDAAAAEAGAGRQEAAASWGASWMRCGDSEAPGSPGPVVGIKKKNIGDDLFLQRGCQPLWCARRTPVGTVHRYGPV